MGRRRREFFFAESSIVHVRRRPVDSNQKTYTRYFHYPKYDVIFGGGASVKYDGVLREGGKGWGSKSWISI